MHVEIDWTAVLVYGLPTWIAAMGGAIAAVVSALNRRNSKTPNGHTLGQLVEEAHGIAQANADKIDKIAPPAASPEHG